VSRRHSLILVGLSAPVIFVVGVVVAILLIFQPPAALSACGAPQAPLSGAAGPLPVSADGWVTTGATLDPTYTSGAFQGFYNNGLSYAELEATPGFAHYSGGGVAGALGLPRGATGLPGGFALLVRAVGSSGPGVRILKSDIGDGAGNAPHATVDLHPAIAAAINFGGKQDIQIKAAGTSPGGPVSSGAQTQAACTTGAVSAGTYVNPFAHVTGLTPQRIDMGVDYDGSGPITTIGAARVVLAGTGIGGGWSCGGGPNGGVVYQLQDGPDRGRYVYVTEDVIPTVTPGPRILPAGAPIANLSGGGDCIEIGWANGPSYSTVAASLGQQSQAGDAGNNRTYCGQQMSDLLASTGVPAGLTGGRPVTGTRCS